MNKRVLALVICTVLVLVGLAGCAGTVDSRTVDVPVTDSDYNTVTAEDGRAVTTEVNAKLDKDGNLVTEAVTDKSGQPVTGGDGQPITQYVTVSGGSDSKDSTESGSTAGAAGTDDDKYIPEGWKRENQTARIVTSDGKVYAEFDLLNYTSSDMDSIQSALEKIIKTGLTGGEVTSSSVKGKTATVTGYGVPVNGKGKVYYMLYCKADKSAAYLVTFSAQEESYLDGDFSAVTKNIKELSGLS